MAHKIYDNFYLSNEIEDQFNSHLDLQQFCTVDNSLVGTPGMLRKINVYSATSGTEKLDMGQGNTKDIEVSYKQKEYRIKLAQNRMRTEGSTIQYKRPCRAPWKTQRQKQRRMTGRCRWHSKPIV